MANQEQNPPQQEQPFVAAKQVGFNLKDIILNTNNEVPLLYPEHNNKDHFKCVFDFISKCCFRKPFTISPKMYKECLAKFGYSAKALENSKVSFSTPTGGIYGEVEVNTFRNAIDAHYLPHSSEYVAPPFINIVRPWFETISLANRINIEYASIFWEDIIIKLNKKRKEKVVPYTRFLSLLMMHKMKEGYGDGELTLYPTQVYSVNNWALKPNQPEEPPFIDHMLAIYAADMWVFQSTTSSKTGHSKKRKESSSAMDSNPSQPPVSTPVDTRMHKEDQQATGGPTSLGVTSEARANPQLSSSMLAFKLNKPIYSASFIIHFESASGCDASKDSTAKADLGLSAPSDFVPQQQGMNEGTKNTLYDHLSAGTDPYVLVDKTKSISEGLEIVLTQPIIEQGASSIARQPSFKDLDSPEDDLVIVVDDTDEDEEDEVHATISSETEDTSSQKHKLERKKNKAEAEAALLKAQPSFPSVGQLNELLVKSLQTEFSKILSAHDFSSSLPTELKDLPSKFNDPTKEVKGLKTQVHNLEIELPGDLKEIPPKLDNFTKTITSLTSQVAELKTLQWELPVEFLSLPK
ncbi:hypothetical protein Tco_1197764 [Tanacetum coccineum]